MRSTGNRRATCSASLMAALTVLSLAATSGAAPPATGALAQGSISEPTYEISLQEAWIPMPDGVRLAADVFMPTGGEVGEKFPVLLEYLPYRKNERRDRNYSLYSYFVERGYVVARVDIRGTGNSEGRTIPYEYSEIEQEDGDVVIDWLSKQSYSSGNVGMFGISWGGFNAIHMAMRNPPALKAIISVAATDDLYQDDVHYIDGIPRLAESWQMSHDLQQARPAAPEYTIDEDYFRDRFDVAPSMMTYIHQQRESPFWDRSSLVRQYERIRIPTFVIGGWYDGYRDTVPRMLENLEAPVKGIIGPWSHYYPHDAYPLPQIEWRREGVRWFDHWLRGSDTGIMDEPAFAVYVRDWHPPGPVLVEAPGEWRWEEGWPIERTRDWTLHAQPNHTLGESVPAGSVHQMRYAPAAGIEAGGPTMYWSDVAPDQKPTDAYSLVYDTAPLAEDTEILGLPHALLSVSASARRANWFARLNDVAPDGTVTLVAGAGFNGTHRNSARDPQDIVPGEVFPLDIEMHFTSWVFPKGHRIRLSVSNSQWPMAWPSRDAMTTTLEIGGDTPARVVLPVIPYEERPVPPFEASEPDPVYPGFRELDTGNASGYGEIGRIVYDTATHTTRVEAKNTGGTEYPWGTYRYLEQIAHEVSDNSPEVSSMTGEHTIELEIGDHTLVWEAELSFRSDYQNFYYNYIRRLLRDGVLIRERSWEDTVERDYQ